MVTSVLSLIIPLIIGFLAVNAIYPQRLLLSQLILKICFSVGVGFGISSCLFFLWSVIFSPGQNGFFIVELVLLVCLAGFNVYRFRKNVKKEELNIQAKYQQKSFWIISAGFIFALVSGIVIYAIISTNSPHGEWDAWAIWNNHARFWARGGDHWTDAFSSITGWSHPDYPLLLPGFIARCWHYIGNETVVIPVITGFLFTFATVGLVCAALAFLKNKDQGLIAGTLLLGTTLFLGSGASQCADVPISFFFLATIILLYFYDKFSGNNMLILAGVTAGFAAWTKNEGLLFLLVVLLARLLIIIPKQGFKAFLNQMKWFGSGLLPILAVIFLFKLTLAPPNDIMGGQNFVATLERLTDFSRYMKTFEGFALNSIFFTRGIIGPWLLIIYLFIFGTTINREDKAGILSVFTVIGLMFAGYFFVYIITPQDLSWHLVTSLHRLFLQLWPSLIFAVFLIVRTPEQTLIKKMNRLN